VKLQLNAYSYVQQRQQQVHAQLQYGANQLDHSDRRTSAEYHHRSNSYPRREMAGVWVNYDLSIGRWELLLAAWANDDFALAYSNCDVKHCYWILTSKEALATTATIDDNEQRSGTKIFLLRFSPIVGDEALVLMFTCEMALMRLGSVFFAYFTSSFLKDYWAR